MIEVSKVQNQFHISHIKNLREVFLHLTHRIPPILRQK